MTEAIGMLVILLGQAVALFIRLYPNGRINQYIPKVVWVANFLGIIIGFINKFIEAAGLGPVASVQPSGVILAVAWGGLWGVLKVAGTAFLATALGAVERWIYEQFGSKVIPQSAMDAGKKGVPINSAN